MTTPEHNDVVFGKGYAIQKRPGNQYFHSLIETVKPTYNTVPKHQRRLQAEVVVNQIQKLDPPGNFLKKNSDGSYEELGREIAVKKAWQSLRDWKPRKHQKGFVSRTRTRTTMKKLEDDADPHSNAATSPHAHGPDSDVPMKMSLPPPPGARLLVDKVRMVTLDSKVLIQPGPTPTPSAHINNTARARISAPKLPMSANANTDGNGHPFNMMQRGIRPPATTSNRLHMGMMGARNVPSVKSRKSRFTLPTQRHRAPDYGMMRQGPSSSSQPIIRGRPNTNTSTNTNTNIITNPNNNVNTNNHSIRPPTMNNNRNINSNNNNANNESPMVRGGLLMLLQAIEQTENQSQC